ncbi:unnamed protein product [Penicillium salamii]|nr:unnamed protein product [Penicillium salamii]CAG8323408.1 unnamed protein product [Penicillium salamii]CAG8406883.1 unnamed protein product [Penicillium salamii]
MTSAWLPWSTQRLHTAVRSEAKWGYVIYRTTYTPKSDIFFPKIIKLLNDNIKHELFAECGLTKKHRAQNAKHTACNEIWTHHLPILMENQTQFDNASIDSVQTHFHSWVHDMQQKDQNILYPMCIVIDEESLQEFMGASSADEHLEDGRLNQPLRYVKVLKAFPTAGSDDIYDAFMGGEFPAEKSDSMGMLRSRGGKEDAVVSESDDDEYDGFLGG